MYANVAKTKVFFIATPLSNGPFKPGTLLAGLDESGRKPQWSLPYATVSTEQVRSMGLFSAAIHGVRKQCGSGLEFASVCKRICVLAVEPATGQVISSPKKNQNIELQMFMAVGVKKGVPNSRNGFFQGVDFYDLDSPHGDVRKHMLPGAQNSALDGFRKMEDLSWPFMQPVPLNLDPLRIRLESLMVRPALVDGLTGRKQPATATGKNGRIAA